MSKPRVLVVGARRGSLGAAVAQTCLERGYEPYTAGIQDEQIDMDLMPTATSITRLMDILSNVQPTHIVCTVGLNMPEPEEQPDLFDWYRWHYETNAIAPMRLLDAWLRCGAERTMVPYGHYVAISSNSARIPRTRSAAYCASKAALSMALRVKAREVSGRPIIYGYEPGLLTGTPMTTDVIHRLERPTAMHRMKPPGLHEGIDPIDLAALIVDTLGHNGLALNGAMIPYDADEL